MVASIETNHNDVRPEDGCPRCGERDADKLIWQENETVRCQTCGTSYRPGEAHG